MKRLIKNALAMFGRIPFGQDVWLALIRWYVYAFHSNLMLRDVLMWDCSTYVLGKDYEVLVGLKTGVRLITGMEDNVTRAVMFCSRYEDFFWEPQTLKLILRLLSPPGVVMVAGGHIGYHALHIAKAIQISGGQVYAFEPVHKFYTRVISSSSISGIENVIVEHAALDRQSREETRFYVSGAQSSLDPRVASKNASQTSVRSVSLDDYVSQKDISHVDLILLDVEGSELNILMGANQLLHSKPDLILEINLPALDKQNLSALDIYRFLFSHGYEIFGILDDYAFLLNAPSHVIKLQPLNNVNSKFCMNAEWFNVFATCHRQKLSRSDIAFV